MPKEAPPFELIDGNLKGDAAKKLEAHELADKLLTRKIMELGARYDVGAGTFTVQNNSMTPNDIADLTFSEQSALQKDVFRIRLKVRCFDLRVAALRKAKGKMLDVPEPSQKSAEELTKFVELMAHPTTDPDRKRYYVAALRQLIWQVKRKLRGLGTSWEIMVCLFSKQGSGKSSVVNKFCAPLGMLYLAADDFSLFTDKFRIKDFGKYYLINLDEMGYAKRTDVDAVKRVITAKVLQARAMRSEEEHRVERNSSFIGTTNRPVASMIKDSSGMRRFVEMRCRDDAYNEEFGRKMRAIDFKLLWQCESGERDTEPPAYHAKELFSKYQAELRTPSNFELFAEHCLEVTDIETDKVSNKTLHNAYKEFCDAQRIREVLDIRKFLAEIKEIAKTYQHRGYWYVAGVKLNPWEVGDE